MAWLRTLRSLPFTLVLVMVVPMAALARLAVTAVDGSQGRSIRVLLLEAPLLTIGAAGRQGLQLRDQAGQVLGQVKPGHQLRVRRMGETLSLELLAKGDGAQPSGPLPALAPPNPPPAGGEAAAGGPDPFPTRPLPLQVLRLEPIQAQDLLVLKQRRYRGVLLLRPEGAGLQAINRLPLESYLLGVVGSEMPGTWPLEALRAQAVASRTYALQQLRPAAPFDLNATVASQMYKGMEAESGPIRQAVASTRGQVLMHGQKLINAVFHSSSGGATENSGEFWSRQLPYLVSVPDFDNTSPVSRWQQAFTPEALRQAFAEIQGATSIQPLQTSTTGRIRRARVIGPGGELVLTGSELRERLGLRSTMVQFVFEPAGRLETPGTLPPISLPHPWLNQAASSGPNGPLDASSPPSPAQASQAVDTYRLLVKGRGYGHGVGMSQWGAYALALSGKSYEDILRHYYKGAILRTY